MGASADFRAYDQAYSKLMGQHVMGARTLSGAEPVGAQAPSSAALPHEPDVPHRRLRAASDAFLAGAGFERVSCPGCGAVLKIPQARQGRVPACPRCGTRL